MNRSLFALLLAVSAASAFSATAINKKEHVIRVHVPDVKHADLLKKYSSTYDIWDHIIPGQMSTIRVLSHQAHFPLMLQKMGFEVEVMIEDLQAQTLADRERHEQIVREHEAKYPEGKAVFNFGQYHRLQELYDFEDDIVAENPNYAFKENMGTSHEGRPMTVVKVCPTGTCSPTIPTMYLECNIHAREWITDGVCAWILDQLTTNKAANQDMLTGLQWYIMLVTNPDGYEYSWNNDRYWRKNRRPNSGSLCYGSDLNRNFFDHFDYAGASDNPCSDTYHGERPRSEPEVQMISNWVLQHKEIVYFQDIHAYSQYTMHAYGWTHTKVPDHAMLLQLCEDGQVELFNVDGKRYQCGNIADVIYEAAGTTVDWAYDRNITYAYTFEARPQSGSPYGFNPPEEWIEPCAEEIFEWHRVVAATIKNQPVRP